MVDTAELDRLLAEHATWLAVERGVAANTLTAYGRDLAAYSAFLRRRGTVDVGGLTEGDVDAYVEHLRSARDGDGKPRWSAASVARARRGRADVDALFVNPRGGRLTRQGCWKIVAAYGLRAGLGGRLSPHVLRHSCATHMVDRGADLRVVQELLGHASVSTTQVYTKVTQSRLRAVYDASHPRARRLNSPDLPVPIGGSRA